MISCIDAFGQSVFPRKSCIRHHRAGHFETRVDRDFFNFFVKENLRPLRVRLGTRIGEVEIPLPPSRRSFPFDDLGDRVI
jgi:hypothetical protein